MSNTLRLRIKKEYAAALIEHLKREDAIEIIEEDSFDIPEWQKEAVRKTLAKVQLNPGLLQPWDIIKQNINDLPDPNVTTNLPGTLVPF